MKILFLLLISISLVSCGSWGDAKKVLKNEKIRTTDEFLVKKKEPLELPHYFKKIHTPDSLEKNANKISEDQKIRKMLNTVNQEQEKKKESSSTEESILNKIRK